MKISRVLAVLCATAVAPLALVVPAAHADQWYAGELSGSDPSAVLPFPDPSADTCAGGATVDVGLDTVRYVSTTDGPRRFVLHWADDSSAYLWVYRNGVCVAADAFPDDDAETAARIVDLDNVVVNKGDQVEVRIGSSFEGTWSLAVQQPGSANAPAVGKAAKYLPLPEQILCATGTAHATFTKKAKKAARKDKIARIVFRSGGVKVAKVKAKRMRKAAKKGVVLQGIPSGATSIDVKVKLRNGKKKAASRPYSAC